VVLQRKNDTEGIDLLEISGGSYESPAMMGAGKKQSTVEREVYFMDYIKKARRITTKPLMLTGGFRTVQVMEQALSDGHVDIIGLGRPFAIYPYLADNIFNNGLKTLETPSPKTGIKAIDKMGNLEVIWYELQIKRIGEGKQPDLNLSGLKAFRHSIWQFMKKSLFKN